ncbi:flagellar hook assembly protein FlgD [Teichococcus cervicalis]|uniref:Basal-body rod modification protein FlgD n=1 Tax=Pseudoroseomonas cervicalis ATCC 49957 TaxID=525371 RepID=D5RM37_9PROT|nr:flagellar hook assembly protein FlgD [Pseudoroseomonas cervicalis]EFH11631.1 flagellar hook capping protein [Pseudoroseomonas cervicalis ATCC 49957]
MASSALTTAASSANSTTQSATAKTQLGSDMQSFLTLLTTQLQNQDPMDPTDSSEFATQLAQFSQVEQQIATNAHLESLLSLQQSASLLSSTGLVGNTVEVSSSQIVLKDGATQGLRLPRLADAGGAQGGIVTITNSSGAVVYTEAVALGTEATSWSWNGKGTNGASLADGRYTVGVSGFDARGTSTGTLDFGVVGKVNSVDRSSGGAPRVNIGGLTVGLEALRGLS